MEGCLCTTVFPLSVMAEGLACFALIQERMMLLNDVATVVGWVEMEGCLCTTVFPLSVMAEGLACCRWTLWHRLESGAKDLSICIVHKSLKQWQLRLLLRSNLGRLIFFFSWIS